MSGSSSSGAGGSVSRRSSMFERPTATIVSTRPMCRAVERRLQPLPDIDIGERLPRVARGERDAEGVLDLHVARAPLGHDDPGFELVPFEGEQWDMGTLNLKSNRTNDQICIPQGLPAISRWFSDTTGSQVATPRRDEPSQQRRSRCDPFGVNARLRLASGYRCVTRGFAPTPRGSGFIPIFNLLRISCFGFLHPASPASPGHSRAPGG